MKNGISHLVEELEAAQEVVEGVRRKLAEELGLQTGAPVVALALGETKPTNGEAKQRKWPAHVTQQKILAALGQRKLQSKEIADTIGVKRASVAYYLQGLLDSKKIKRTGLGVYRRVA